MYERPSLGSIQESNSNNSTSLLEPIPFHHDDEHDGDNRRSSLLSNWSRFSFGSLIHSRGSLSSSGITSDERATHLPTIHNQPPATNSILSTNSGSGIEYSDFSVLRPPTPTSLLKLPSSRSIHKKVTDITYSIGSSTGTNLLPHNHELAQSTRTMIAEQWTLMDAFKRHNDNNSNNHSSSSRNNTQSSSNNKSNNHQPPSDQYPKSEEWEELCQRVNQLPLHERDRATHDVYGFNHVPSVEDPIQLQQWMEEMDHWLTTKERHVHPSLQTAMNTNMKYIHTHKIEFLRAEDWKPDRAASRMGRYFDLKEQYFGRNTLCRDVTLLDDMPPEDLVYWRNGFVQLLEERDRSGRPVVMLFGKVQIEQIPVETVIRVSFYLCQVLTKDETVQRAGCVLLYYGVGQRSINNIRAQYLLHSWRCMPLRGVAQHICYDSMLIHTAIHIAGSIMHPFHAMRVRAHYGTHTECMYNLMTYGIPRHAIPILDDDDNNDDDGVKIDVTFHNCFLDALIRQEGIDKERRLKQQQLKQQQQQPDQQQQIRQEQDRGVDDGDEHQPYDAQLDRNSWNIMVDTEGGTTLSPELLLTLATTGLAEGGTDTVNNDPPQTEILHIDGTPQVIPDSSSTSNNDDDDNGIISNELLILVPGPDDVIMGRGRHNKNKAGNRKLTKMIEEYHAQYEAADKFQKTVIAEHVLTAMTESGSRFLIRESPPPGRAGGSGGAEKLSDTKSAGHGLWVQVTQERARDKIAHDFRNLRRTDVKKVPATAPNVENDDDNEGDDRNQQSNAISPSNNKRTLSRNEVLGSNLSSQQPQKEQKRSSSMNPFAAMFFS